MIINAQHPPADRTIRALYPGKPSFGTEKKVNPLEVIGGIIFYTLATGVMGLIIFLLYLYAEQRIQFIFPLIIYTIGILFSLKIVIQIAAVFFIVTAGLFAYNTFKIILHKEDIKPLK